MSGRRRQAISRSRLTYSQLRPAVGPLGVCLSELSLAAGRSAVTFSHVYVAQQLELQDCPFFYFGSTSIRFGRAREGNMSSGSVPCIQVNGRILRDADALDNRRAPWTI